MFAVFAGDLVLIRDVDYFGRDIRRGSIFRLVSGTKDMYRLYENKDGIVMECPAIQVHFSSVRASHFQEVFQNKPSTPCPCVRCANAKTCKHVHTDPYENDRCTCSKFTAAVG